MKVVFVSRSFYPDIVGGGQVSAYYIAKSVAQHAEVVVCCLSEKIKKPVVEHIEGLKIYRFPWKKFKHFPRLSNLEYVYWQMYKGLKHVYKKEKPDVLHFLNFSNVFPVVFGFRNVPKFATCNGPWFCNFDGYHHGKGCYKCKNKDKIPLALEKWGLLKAFPFLAYTEYALKLLQMSLKSCSRVFPVSQAMHKMLRANGIPKKKLRIIHNPIEVNTKRKTDLRKKLGLTKKKILLYAGRLVEDKGIQFVIPALPNDVMFLVVGKGSYKPVLEKLVQKHQAQDKIKFVGFVKHDVLQEYYSIADVVVMTGILYDALPRAMLEAASYGIPCLVNNMGGAPEIIEHDRNGIVLQSLAPSAVRKALNALLNDTKLYKRYSKGAIEKVRSEFTCAVIGRQLIEQYKEVLDETHSTS